MDARTIGAVDPEDRATVVLAQLQDIIDTGTEVDIIGLPYGDLEGYQILSVSPMQDMSTGAQLVATIEARQRLVATVSEVDAPAPRVERRRRSRDTGTQPATDPSTAESGEADASRDRSDVLGILEGLGSILGGS